MFLCSLIEELCRKEESNKTGCNFNFGHECMYIYIYTHAHTRFSFSLHFLKKIIHL